MDPTDHDYTYPYLLHNWLHSTQDRSQEIPMFAYLYSYGANSYYFVPMHGGGRLGACNIFLLEHNSNSYSIVTNNKPSKPQIICFIVIIQWKNQ